MVHLRRNYHECFKINYTCSSNKNQKTKKRKASKDIGIYRDICMESSYSTESLHCKTQPKTYKNSVRPLNRCQQKLCCSTHSINEPLLRCPTPLRKGKKAIFEWVEFLMIDVSSHWSYFCCKLFWKLAFKNNLKYSINPNPSHSFTCHITLDAQFPVLPICVCMWYWSSKCLLQ